MVRRFLHVVGCLRNLEVVRNAWKWGVGSFSCLKCWLSLLVQGMMPYNYGMMMPPMLGSPRRIFAGRLDNAWATEVCF